MAIFQCDFKTNVLKNSILKILNCRLFLFKIKI